MTGELAVDLERDDRTREHGHVDLPDVPGNVRVRVHSEVAHEGREVDVFCVELRLDRDALHERLHAHVRQDDLTVGDPHRDARTRHDVLFRHQIGLNFLRKIEVIDLDVVGLDVSVHVGDAHALREARFEINADPPVGSRQIRCPLDQAEGRTRRDVSIDPRKAAGGLRQVHVEVAEGQRHLSFVRFRKAAARSGRRLRVEIGGTFCAQTMHRDRVRIDPQPRVDHAQRVVVDEELRWLVVAVRIGETRHVEPRFADPKSHLER